MLPETLIGEVRDHATRKGGDSENRHDSRLTKIGPDRPRASWAYGLAFHRSDQQLADKTRLRRQRRVSMDSVLSTAASRWCCGQNPRASFTKIAVIRPGTIDLLTIMT